MEVFVKAGAKYMSKRKAPRREQLPTVSGWENYLEASGHPKGTVEVVSD
jgi:hypothetical protein